MTTLRRLASSLYAAKEAHSCRTPTGHGQARVRRVEARAAAPPAAAAAKRRAGWWNIQVTHAAGGYTRKRHSGGQTLGGRTHWTQPLSLHTRRVIMTEASALPMEVEVKLRLPDQAAYDKVAALFDGGKGPKAVYAQENNFFDGSNKELSSQRTVLRLRFFNHDERAVFTIKGKQVLENGIGRATEVEEDADPKTARRFLTHPDEALRSSPLLSSTSEKLGVKSLVSLGGFKNQRRVYDWQGETIELDATSYEHGTLYEIECESVNPETVREKLEQLLKENDIQYAYCTSTKFANFLNKTLE